MRIGNSRNIPEYQYKLENTSLDHISKEKELGVTIDNKLKFTQHIDEKVTKANSMMGLIRRTFRHLNSTVKYLLNYLKP